MGYGCFLNATVNVETPTYTKVDGARVATWSTLYAACPARINEISASAQAEYLRNDLRITHEVRIGTPDGVTPLAITQAERMKFAPGTTTPRYFKVTSPKPSLFRPDGISYYWTCQCEEVQP